jgi:16S rRNA (guanine966-N2)-methyltransferase
MQGRNHVRINAGAHKGLKLAVPAGADLRPTADRARQAIFNILIHTFDGVTGARVLDVFAGSGALGIEALSRGATSLVAIEKTRAAADCIKRNLTAAKESERAIILLADALDPPEAARHGKFAPCDLVFLDAPYGEGLTGPALAALAKAGWLAGNALVVAETGAREALDLPPGFSAIDDRRYGKARMRFLRYGA